MKIDKQKANAIALAVEYEIMQAMGLKKTEYDTVYFCPNKLPERYEVLWDGECSYGGWHDWKTDTIQGIVLGVLEKLDVYEE